MLNAFCIDLEDWFHICDARTPYDDPTSWASAPSFVEEDTQVILDILKESETKATFLTLGWIAEKYPALIEKITAAGHEIGCHTYGHRLLYTMTPDELRCDLERCLEILRSRSGQQVTAFRAPGFSMKKECYWAYPILHEFGLTVDVSIVPAVRDHGGIDGFTRDPFLLRTESGNINIFPVSVMSVLGKTVPFSGGGYLRLFPLSLLHAGFRQNIKAGRACMTYIHPRETNFEQPRLRLPLYKYFKYYVGIKSAKKKLTALLEAYSFSTVQQVVASVSDWPEYELVNGNIQPV